MNLFFFWKWLPKKKKKKKHESFAYILLFSVVYKIYFNAGFYTTYFRIILIPTPNCYTRSLGSLTHNCLTPTASLLGIWFVQNLKLSAKSMVHTHWYQYCDTNQSDTGNNLTNSQYTNIKLFLHFIYALKFLKVSSNI